LLAAPVRPRAVSSALDVDVGVRIAYQETETADPEVEQHPMAKRKIFCHRTSVRTDQIH
jgi:hypothetical protein